MTTLHLITKEDFQEFKAELFSMLEKFGVTVVDKKYNDWLKSGEVRKLLKISPGTLQNLRITGALRYTKVGKMFYYKYDDIIKVLEDNKSDRKGNAL
jgi:Helix-turn-helix domain